MKTIPQNASCHALPADELARVFETDGVRGLAQEEAARRLAVFGRNSLAAEKKTKRLLVFLAQFKNPIVYLLLAAAAVSFFFGDYEETAAILVVLFINAFIGYWMEMQAMRSMDALKKFDLVFAKAWRNGGLVEIPSEEIVPGDILFLDAGDIVPADARLLSVSRLEVDESPLTGESVPVQKSTEPLPEGTLTADRINMVFKGTALTKGNGNALVVGTGMHTELGRISGMVQRAGKEEIPLNVKLNAFSRKLIWIFVPVVLLFFLFSVIRGSDLLVMLKVSIALAVAAIPEGLPIVATITLARGMLKLAKQQVIVKKLAAVETLGSANVILTDKTGTLTQNRLQVNTICLPGKSIGITWNETEKSISYLPHTLSTHEQENLQKLLHVGILCNNASFTDSENSVGDPIEVALLKLGEYHRSGLLSEMSRVFSRVYEQPFDSNVKMMGTIHESGGERMVAVKGATEEVLRHASYILHDGIVKPFSDTEKKEWTDRTDQLASGGLRVLAFAYKDRVPGNEDFMRELIFTGLAGFLDLPREEVPDAIKACHDAGIRVVMVTGDHPETAKNIAARIGLGSGPDVKVMHGKELKTPEQMTEQERAEILDTLIFSRVSPAQKLDLVKLYQEHGLIVCMTGDGVNDAPALQKSDIGIAMGKRGTQVAREAADLVLQDDSFASIAKAIKYGRVIYDNIGSFIVYLLSCNLSEIVIVSCAAFLDLGLPLLPLQILFLNIVTDVFPALALGMNNGSALVMKKKSRPPDEPIVSRKKWFSIIAYAFGLVAGVLPVYICCHEVMQFSAQTCSAIAFLSIAFAQLLHPLNLAAANENFFVNPVTRNRYLWLAVGFCAAIIFVFYFIPSLNSILNLGVLDAQGWLLVAIGSILPVPLIQLFKRSGLVA